MTKLFDTRYYYLTKLFCSMVGLWPYQAQNKRIFIQTFNILILLSYVPPQLNRLHQVWRNDIDAVCMCMPPVFTIFLCSSKIMTLTLCRSKFYKLVLSRIPIRRNQVVSDRETLVAIQLFLVSQSICLGRFHPTTFVPLIQNVLVHHLAETTRDQN
ncbi:uncharacterized protein LOC112589712 [Harpegnathos saltator]|uniref:uncharacterized protein LOC112589712 n=1 Tax=Harpegnathos saltator TaxID=610380 RepID=UPI000DBEEF71|nr:uncharacterized protein LOC112589712 [Harpegnathos saltator]